MGLPFSCVRAIPRGLSTQARRGGEPPCRRAPRGKHSVEDEAASRAVEAWTCGNVEEALEHVQLLRVGAQEASNHRKDASCDPWHTQRRLVGAVPFASVRTCGRDRPDGSACGSGSGANGSWRTEPSRLAALPTSCRPKAPSRALLYSGAAAARAPVVSIGL